MLRRERVNALQRTVTRQHLLEQVIPSVTREIHVAETVQEQVLPDAAIIPVGSSCGNDGLISRERVQVPHATRGALQTLRGIAASDVVVDTGQRIEPQVIDGLISLIHRDTVGGVILKKFVTGDQRKNDGQQQQISDIAFHHCDSFLEGDGYAQIIRPGDGIHVLVINAQCGASRRTVDHRSEA